MTAIEDLVHQSAQTSDQEKKRHLIFMTAHLAVGLLALAGLPFFMMFAQTEASPLAYAPIWMLAPLISVTYLSKTGKLANAFLLTAALCVAFIGWIASLTGGLLSPHLIWLGVIPLEVSLSGNRTIVKKALSLCLGIVALLGLAQFAGMAPIQDLSTSVTNIIGGVSILVAIIYGGLLAIRIEWLHRGQVKRIKDKEQHYHTIADTISDMITRHDAKGDVLFVSPAVQSVINHSADAVLGNGLFQCIHIPDRPAYLKALSDCMNNSAVDRDPIAVELQIMAGRNSDDDVRHPEQVTQGVLRWVEMKCAAERGRDGKIVGVIVSTRDISKRKKHQFALEGARQEAERANDAKTHFLANVTHELRTPLNTIIGFSEILCHQDELRSSEETRQEYAKLIHKGGQHLLQLVNDLLDMSRIESGNFEVHPQHFDMADLVQSCCKMMQANADQRNITLFFDNDCVTPKTGTGVAAELLEDTNLDPRACRQIILNLLSNAIKFSDENAKVSVKLDWATQSPSGLTDTSRIILSIRDHGIGIHQDDIAKLGTPFVQAENSYKRRYEGTGIGLSIVKGLAELQHGKMHIESELDVGTTVSITLPCDMEQTASDDEDMLDTVQSNSLVKIAELETNHSDLDVNTVQRSDREVSKDTNNRIALV